MEIFKLTALIVAGALWSAFLVAFLHKKDVHPIREILDRFSRLGWLCKVGVLFLVIQLTMFGGAKHGGTNDVEDVTGTNDVEIVEGGETNDLGGVSGEADYSPLQLMMLPPLTSGLESDSPLSVTDIARGYRLESVTTNFDISYAMPTEGEVRGTWHLTGAYEDVQQVGLGDFYFPLGTNRCASLWAYTWGKVRPQLKNITNEIAAVGAPMSAIPDVSRFWTATTSSNSYLMTWGNFVLGRQQLTTNNQQLTTVSAQIELYPTGDFITRSNEVETAWRRINPDDWDDDGIPNEEDDEPFVRAVEAQFGPHQEVPEGDDPDHYCWVDIVVRGANARVQFVGEGGSWLPDPNFIAEANATNRVMILIGKTYAVHCSMPVDVIAKSDEDIDTWMNEGVLMIEWPVWFEYVNVGPLLMASPLLGSGSGGGGTTIRIHPTRMGGGDYSWVDDFCCYSFAADGTPVFNCQGGCGCGGGCYTGEVTYDCSGHEFSFGGWSCGCGSGEDDDPHGEDDPDSPPAGPDISANFSHKAIIFEDAYTNAPGQIVGWHSTESEISCYAYGGTNGISYSFTIEGADGKLLRVGGARFPMTGTLAAGESFSRRVTYKAIGPSTNVEDIVVTATYTENGTGASDSKEEKVTAVKVKVEATASFPANKVRHVFGPLEEYNIITTPSGFGVSGNDAPFNAGAFTQNLSIQGVGYGVSCTVIHPATTLRGEFVREMTAADWAEEEKAPLGPTVVGAGFVAQWYLMPSHVSFSKLWICEGEAPVSSRWGCFTDETNYPAYQYEHHFGNGSGRYVQIGTNNEFGSLDRIGVQLGVPPSSSGGFSLVIPIYWDRESGSFNHGIGPLVQAVSVTSDGETTISKDGLYLTRGVQR